MHLTHKIALAPTPAQEVRFLRAAGCARFTWNYALAEWNRLHGAGERPDVMAIKRESNRTKYAQFPWLADIHRDAHAQPFAYLAKAWARFFADLRAGARPAPADRAERQCLRASGVKVAYPPTFKKKGRARDSFYVANDKFHLVDEAGRPAIRLPKVGLVRLTEHLRFAGKILGATVSRTAQRWFVAIQVEVPKGTRLPQSANRTKAAQRLAATHARVASLRADFMHKLTTRLCRENQALGIEDLCVRGMLANHHLARPIADACFFAIRRQLTYKAQR